MSAENEFGYFEYQTFAQYRKIKIILREPSKEFVVDLSEVFPSMEVNLDSSKVELVSEQVCGYKQISFHTPTRFSVVTNQKVSEVSAQWTL